MGAFILNYKYTYLESKLQNKSFNLLVDSPPLKRSGLLVLLRNLLRSLLKLILNLINLIILLTLLRPIILFALPLPEVLFILLLKGLLRGFL